MKVNAWTQWGKLKTVVVGRADSACFQPEEPGFRGKIKDPKINSQLNWPVGPKKQSIIDAANRQLDNLSQILIDLGIKVLRPSPVEFLQEIKTPSWQISNMFCCVCPRDVMITVGNYIIEASMSKRSRFFEYLPYKAIMYKLWDKDPNMKWKVAPKPSMDNNMYWEGYWNKFDNFDQLPKEKQYELLYEYRYVLNESEIAFDAADISRLGKDIFVQHSMTTNLRAVEWLRRELDGYVRIHVLNFPYDKEPSHIDCTFVPLKPPREGKKGIILTNPERPLLKKDIQFFERNNWQLLDVPKPNIINYPMPTFCQSSKWLSMNLLSLSEETLVVEESEKELHNFLESLGFSLIKVPFRDVYEFGGSIHCATWDIERDDQKEVFFE